MYCYLVRISPLRFNFGKISNPRPLPSSPRTTRFSLQILNTFLCSNSRFPFSLFLLLFLFILSSSYSHSSSLSRHNPPYFLSRAQLFRLLLGHNHPSSSPGTVIHTSSVLSLVSYVLFHTLRFPPTIRPVVSIYRASILSSGSDFPLSSRLQIQRQSPHQLKILSFSSNFTLASFFSSFSFSAPFSHN